METKEPCIDCPNKEQDEYGYLCDLACGKRTAWLYYIRGFKAGMEEESTQAYHAGLHDGVLKGMKRVVEWVETQRFYHSPMVMPHASVRNKMTEENKLREQVAIKFCEAQDIDFWTPYGHKVGYDFADQILNLTDKYYKDKLKGELNGLTVIGDRELAKAKQCELYESIADGDLDCANCSGRCREVAQAQRDSDIEELKERLDG